MRSAEIAKYADAYSDPAYRMGDERRAWMLRMLSSLPVGTLLDVGAGRGETIAAASAAGFRASGTEVVRALIAPPVVYAEAHALPFDDQSFDVVTCLDVIEHLLHHDHAAAIGELCRVARRQVIVTAADYSHVVDGVELHVGRRAYDEWDQLIRENSLGRVERLGWCGSAEGWRIVKDTDCGN